MNLTIRNSPYPDQNPYIRKAIYFYGKKLMHGNLLRNLTLSIEFKDVTKREIDGEVGPMDVRDLNDPKNPRNFKMYVSNTLARNRMFVTLAHEMVHVKQYATGELIDVSDVSMYNDFEKEFWKVYWKGELIICDGTSIEYPWEIEANGLEAGLFHHFKKEYGLEKYFSSGNHSICPHCEERINKPRYERSLY